MNPDTPSFAERRQALIAECALQRGDLAADWQSLAAPLGDGGVRGFLAGHKTATLAAAGVALGLVATQPKRVLKLAAAGLSVWKLARNVLPMIAAARQRGGGGAE